MTGAQYVTCILGVSAMLCGVFVWKAYLNRKVRDHQIRYELAKSENETKRFVALVKLANLVRESERP